MTVHPVVRVTAAAACVWALGLTLSCNGTTDPSNFHGWMSRFEGTFEMERDDNEVVDFVHQSHFPCNDCYLISTELGRREVSMRFVNSDGHRVRLRFSLGSLNEDKTVLKFENIPNPVVENSIATAEPPEVGFAALYVNGEPLDEGGELEVFDATWPLYPGDAGRATLHINDASFEGQPVEGAFVVDLYVSEGDGVPPGYGERNAPCAGYICFDEDDRCVEEDVLTCRQVCDPFDAGNVCESGQECVALEGAGICRDATGIGTVDRECPVDRPCDDDLICAATGQGAGLRFFCRARCDDGACPAGSACVDDFCIPSYGLGFRDGPCVGAICVTGDLVCVGEEDGNVCRQTCDVGDDDCGFRSRCLAIPDRDVGGCFPASGDFGPCPCDNGYACVTPTAGEEPLCLETCNPNGPNTCSLDRACAPLAGDPETGICL